jgi:zinc finger MYND domain-containing protein 10
LNSQRKTDDDEEEPAAAAAAAESAGSSSSSNYFLTSKKKRILQLTHPSKKMSAAQFAHVQELLAPDAQRLVESLHQFAISDIGSKAWLEQHTAVEKLNMQAQHSIVKQGDEYVIEALVDYDKLPVLIAELIALEAWQEQALPSLFEDIAAKNSVKGYFILYHEALLLGLLEKAVFHKHAIAAAGDMLLELADFCYRKTLFLNHGKLHEMIADPGASSSASESLRHQQYNITYGVSMSCLTIIRFLLEAQDELPLGVLSRFVEENDVLQVLVPLLECQPWLRKTKKGINEKFSDGRWYEVDGDEVFRLSKTEAQASFCRCLSTCVSCPQ